MEKKKTRFWRRGLALVLAVSLIAGTFLMLPTKAADTANLGKLGDSFVTNNSTFNLNTGSSRFFLGVDPNAEGNEALLQTVQLIQRQFAADGIDLPIVWHTSEDRILDGDIVIKLVSSSGAPSGILTDEGYQLEVAKHATVTATGVDGLLYGANMLQKHLRYAKQSGGFSNNTYSISGFTMVDDPDTKERTVQLDCARKYLTVEYICNFIKEASWMGYNSLQLHVSEDGGFRADFWDPDYYVEGEFYPENDFSWLCGSHVQSWVQDETDVNLPNYREDPDKNKHLTTAELIQIIDTCKEYHIDIIPSFDSPAHMDYLTWKFEQNYKSNTSYSFTYNGTTYKASATNGCINYSGTTGGATPTWPNYTTMDIRDGYTRGEMSQAFVKCIYEDMADFFKYYAGSTKFNIGADEVNLTNIAIYKTAWNYSLLPGYINEINSILNSKGYTCRIFNDFIDSGALAELDDNIEILFWNTPYNSITGTDNAYTVDYNVTAEKTNSYGNKYTVFDEHPMTTVSQYVSDGRTVYNCVNLHTYYVLRVAPNGKGGAGGELNPSNGDARSTKCYQWEFYAADEESIYTKWTPNNIRKDGLYKESDRIVDDAHFGGAYFLTWHDYATVNTETEMWNGVKDTVNNNGQTYSVRKRMWSNIIKQWNWDINSSSNSQGTVSYSAFADVRDKLGDFPGLEENTYSDATKATTLPAAIDPIQLGDHANLTAKLSSGKIPQGNYTSASYAIYSAAYENAVTVNNNPSASDAELTDALNRLVNAENGLVEQTYRLSVYYKAKVNGNEISIDYDSFSLTPAQAAAFNIRIAPVEGYSYLRIEGNATFTLSDSGDGSGYLTGSIAGDTSVTLWYESSVDTSRLNALLFSSYTSQEIGSTRFTDSSWAVYNAALTKAKNFSANTSTRQADVDALVSELAAAANALVTPGDDASIEVEFLNDSFVLNGQVGLHIQTSPNVKSITIKNVSQDNRVETLNHCSGEVQVLNDGTVVKYWAVFFTLGNSGDYEVVAAYDVDGVEMSVSQII